MRYRSLRKWDDIENSKGLIFTAQLIDELLFDFTLDTYKPSAMNTSLLVRESLATISAIETGTIKRPNLKHILDELCENLRRDEIALSLLSVDINGINQILKNPKSTVSSVATSLELLSRQLPLSRYKEKNEELMMTEILGEQRESKLRALTRSYITTLLNFGFSAKYIQSKSQQFFFYSGDRISGNQAIADYLNLFSGELRKFEVIYRAPCYLSEFGESAENFQAKIRNSIESHQDSLDRFHFNLSANEVFVHFEEIKSKEPYFAKSIADNRVELFQTLIGLYHHKESPKPIIECLVNDIESSDCIKVTQSINPMHKCHDLKTDTASGKLSLFMKGFLMRGESFRKFNRSAELHALALSSESTENQMINLWIALESIIPNKDDEDNSAQIEHVAKSILPFLNIKYVNKLIECLSKDIFNWDRNLHRRLLNGISGADTPQKFAKFLALDEYEEKRSELESSFRNFHLLKDRYMYFRQLLSSPESLIQALDNHTKRVEWQIRRIYRARNMIVHDGVTPTYTEVLIENTHDYLDSVMNGLMSVASAEHTLNTISQGFKLVEINYQSYYKALSSKGLVFTDDNIDELLFKHQI